MFVLGLAAAEEDVDLVVLLDLYEGEHSFEFRPDREWFSFDGEMAADQRSSRQRRGAPAKVQAPSSGRSGASSGRSPGGRAATRPGTMSTRSMGGGNDDGDRLRLRISGGYVYVHPLGESQKSFSKLLELVLHRLLR